MNTTRQRTSRLAAAALAAGTLFGGAAFGPATAVAPHHSALTPKTEGDAVGAGSGPARTVADRGLSPAQALTISFNDVPSSGNPELTHLSTDGSSFDGVHFHTIDTPGLCGFGGCLSNDTIYIAEEEGGVGQPFTMTRPSGTTFKLARVELGQLFNDDAAAAAAGSPNATAVTLTGTLSGGGTLTRSFQLPDFGIFSYPVPRNWRNLVSVRFAANGAFAADNIKIARVR